MVSPTFQLDQSAHIVVAAIDSQALGGAEAEALIEELGNRMRYDGATHFVLNLAKVEHMDSSCLGVLVQFLQDLENVHGRIGLANCRPNVAFLFKVTRLDTVFSLHDDVESARLELA